MPYREDQSHNKNQITCDHRDEIRGELDELVKEGELIKLRDAIQNHPESREKVRKQLAETDAAANKAKGSKKSAAKSKAEKSDLVSKLLVDEPFGTGYQRWYSRALRVVEQLLPDRYDEFRELNRLDKHRRELDVTTYTISE